MSNQSILRITRELSDIQKGSDLSIAVACRDIDVRHVRALIVGPPDTPYEFGFFEFSVKFPRDYPTKPPTVQAITTNGGRTRFNPNIYAGGKSLMSSNPYENEPGYETLNGDSDKKHQKAYVQKIRHETIRISVVERLEEYLRINRFEAAGVEVYTAQEASDSGSYDMPFEPFRDLCKRRFLWYYHSYLHAIEEESKDVKDGSEFQRMPFEGAGNIMEGTFRYAELRKRLDVIRKRLDMETDQWAKDGLMAVQKELSIANTLERQFEQTVEWFKNNDSVALDLELVDKNPFVWQLVLFGRPMTNLDGGMFRMKLHMSTRFPEEQPRVRFETPIFHQRVSKDGVLCYFPPKPDDLKSHIQAIVEAIEEEEPAYDPRTIVNSEAATLFWGSKDDKKLYNRRLRRSVQESTE
ncbi:hypothetical protein H2199_002645 [Coniosporium tulheliwenetii]|uniref:Uncharacterized protein n=1 Tax=Coniosporium tulheliwenetii TaxID=3383036 RepID=A0ACC2ZH19_9PEZI|nr:hypothetical protein H2199_002645 [Cladosporium sp. JES 115]